MTPHPKRSPATGGVATSDSPAAVSPNRSRNRGPAGRHWAAGADLDRETIRRRRQRARPPVVVRARRVVGEVEVEQEPAVLHAEIRALHRVQQVAPGAAGLAAARQVAERQEHPAAVAVEPVELELAELEAGEAEPGEADPRARAARDLERLRLDGPDVRLEPQVRVVREVLDAPE